MATSSTTRYAAPAVAVGAVLLALYAWVGPFWFTGVPERASDPGVVTPPGDGSGAVVGSDRPDDFSTLTDALAGLREPEAESSPGPDDANDDAGNDPPPVRNADPLRNWRYAGYFGSVVILTLPNDMQITVTEGQEIDVSPRPTLVRVDRDEIEFEIDGERYTLPRERGTAGDPDGDRFEQRGRELPRGGDRAGGGLGRGTPPLTAPTRRGEVLA